ncbi:MAG: oligosaccharide flippase family protein, partial [Anaerolineales bacterium]|nr:oligosaccharide flippase family protein [Anaerolineales bacterium]
LLALLTPLLGSFYADMTLLGPVIYAYIVIAIIRTLNTARTNMISKDLEFGRLAVVDVAGSITMTVVGPLMAWLGFGIWAIVGENLSGVLMRAGILWLGFRGWRPRLGIDRPVASWFWQYGIRSWWASNFSFILDRFDDFWVGTALGQTPLGFYSRAYEFANYPRRVVSSPILAVFFPTFAHIQDDRMRLSRAFFRAMSLMVRVGCLFSLIFIFTAPEFILLILGERWLPMLRAFQLMIIYTLLDPLENGATNLMMATGFPGDVMRIRGIQVIVFIPAVIALASLRGIEGVALAADVMIAVGAVLLFRLTYKVVDYSSRAMWLWPLIAFAATAALTLALNPVWIQLSPWASLFAKIGFTSVLFLGLLWITEREQLLTGMRMIQGLLRQKPVEETEGG